MCFDFHASYNKHLQKYKRLITFILLGIAFITAIYTWLLLFKFLFGEYTNNTPTSPLSTLKWPQGHSRIYYETDKGIFSILTDGTEKKLIYSDSSVPSSLSFILIDKTHELLIQNKTRIMTTDADGNNQKTLFESGAGKHIHHWSISPDESQLMIVLENDHNPHSYLVMTYCFTKIHEGTLFCLDNEKDLSNPSENAGEGSYWSTDSTKQYITTLTWATPNEGMYKYFTVDTQNQKVTQIGESPYTPKGAPKKLFDFIKTSPAVSARPVAPWDTYYYKRTSPDTTQTITVNSDGHVTVNNEEIFFWLTHAIPGTQGCIRPAWLPDNRHFLVECNGIRVVEIDTKKITILDKDGKQAQHFDQQYDHQ